MLTEIIPARGGSRYRGTAKPYLVVSKTRGKNKENVVFYLSKEMKGDLRWIAGDRVAVLVDKENGIVHLRRVKEGGFALSACGKNGSASISMTNAGILPAVPYSAIKEDECTVVDGDFIFPYPYPK